MPIKNDLSELSAGVAPDRNPLVAPMIMRAWQDTVMADTDRAMSIDNRRWRASWAGMCTRATQHLIAGDVESEPPDAPSIWRMRLGALVHSLIDDVVEHEAFAGYTVRVEQAVDLEPLGVSGAATADLILENDDTGALTVCEIKTVGGYAYKLGATTFRGAPEGPKTSHVRQAALAAAALSADEMRVLWLAMEPVSEDLAKGICDDTDLQFAIGRVAAEWVYNPVEFCAVADQEVRRVNWILDKIDAGELVPRTVFTDEGRVGWVTNPSTGAYEIRSKDQVLDVGSTWQCGYCRSQSVCINEGD